MKALLTFPGYIGNTNLEDIFLWLCIVATFTLN
jgi:hypothetical protein